MKLWSTRRIDDGFATIHAERTLDGARPCSGKELLSYPNRNIQERAEYGAHLLSDFLFPHV